MEIMNKGNFWKILILKNSNLISKPLDNFCWMQKYEHKNLSIGLTKCIIKEKKSPLKISTKKSF